MSDTVDHESGRRPGLSLQNRIAAVAMLTAVSVLLATCALFIFEQWRAERSDQLHNQVYLARTLAQRLGPALSIRDGSEAGGLLASLEVTPSIRAAVLTDAAGQVVARYGRALAPKDAHRSHRLLESRTPIYDGRERVGELVIGSVPQSLLGILPRYVAVSGGLFFTAMALALLLGRSLAHQVTDPIDRLSAAMRAVAAGGAFDQPVRRAEGDELGRLTDTFNGLLRRLHENDQALRKTLSDLVHARDAAETANLMKSQFLANMSHEIRTPLNGVLAMAQVMALGEVAPEQRERIRVIRQSGETLLTVLNDILDVSKIEAGKLELETVDFDLGELVHGVSAGFEPLAVKKGVRYTLSIDASAVGERRGDAGRLRQILNNLISNAVKFTADGEVVVDVTGEGEGGGDGLRVTVTDTGIGIAPEKLPLLFQKFTQVDSSTTRQYGGTGLGLAICHELALLMGGRVWAESAEGRGSSFHVVLPLPCVGPGCASHKEANQALPADQGRLLRVLAAEDNATNQLVLSTIFEIFGAELHLVDDGQAAVEAWRAGDFDAILMDIQMPRMDGVAATRAIRVEEAARGARRIPIVALSANAMPHQIEEYLRAGMDGHLAKPIELPKLHAALEAALAETSAQRAAA